MIRLQDIFAAAITGALWAFATLAGFCALWTTLSGCAPLDPYYMCRQGGGGRDFCMQEAGPPERR